MQCTFCNRREVAVAGPLVAPLAAEMVQRLEAAYPPYQRLLSYWPAYAPLLGASLSSALQEAGDAVRAHFAIIIYPQ